MNEHEEGGCQTHRGSDPARRQRPAPQPDGTGPAAPDRSAVLPAAARRHPAEPQGPGAIGHVSIDYLELADFLLIAEAVLQTPAKEIAQDSSLNLADSALHAPQARFVGEEFYPEFPTKAAVLGAHLVKNHPLRDGNVQVALVATVEFCTRNGFHWSPPPSDEDGEATARRLPRPGRLPDQRRGDRRPGRVDRRAHRLPTASPRRIQQRLKRGE